MDRYAILIGIDDQDRDGLTKCAKDAHDFAKILEEYCSFKTKNIFKIVSRHGDENKFALNEFENRVESFKNSTSFGSGDLLLIYFSGHGTFDNITEQSYLKFPSKKLSTTKVKEFVDKLHPKHAIIIFDACFVGAKILSKSFNLNKLKRKLHIDSECVFGIYGSPTKREAYLPDELDNSLLTHFLMEVIIEEDNYDADGLLSIDNIASICSKKVYNYSNQLVKKKELQKEQIIVREGRIEGWLPFAQINKSQLVSNIKTQRKKPKNSKKIKPQVIVNNPNFESEKKDFNLLLNNVKQELKKFDSVVVAIILSYYSEKPYQPNYEYYKSEINKAIRKGIIDMDDGEVNYSNRDVSALIKVIEELVQFITDEVRSNEFDKFFDKIYKISPFESDNQTFWENVYDINVPSE
jgi:hypothetical protein